MPPYRFATAGNAIDTATVKHISLSGVSVNFKVIFQTSAK
jgi:hypothetical protein